MQAETAAMRLQARTIGFVPTMGALHDGHMSLVRRARTENDAVVVSIFVNPTQFGPGEDFDAYPRDRAADLEKCASEGVDLVFAPGGGDMYPEGHCTTVDVLRLTDNLCGLSRPGHFRGVATVVLKLLNIVQPHRAYFGEKDYQQFLVVKRMVRDLFIPVEIVPCELFRDRDGLAMSSRNNYLSAEERVDALVLKEALDHFRRRVEEGELSAVTLMGEMAELIESVPSTQIDYVAIVDADTLEDLSTIKGRVLAALAVMVGDTRLIDNTVVEV
ncbi:MAG: pantoate--beta-alanine ligase [Planctomycetes bacterium]|nr:pantoate--beta-alanine ligase [Planctomycetota bacterium]